MNNKPFKTTEIINLFMIDRLVLFFSRKEIKAEAQPDRHGHYELYFIEEGRLTIEIEGREIFLEKGHCLLTAPLMPHRIIRSEKETLLKLSGFLSPGELLFPLCGKAILLSEDEQNLLKEIGEEGAICFEPLPKGISEIGYLPRKGISAGRLQALKNKLEIFLIKLIEAHRAEGAPARRTTLAEGIYRYLTAHLSERLTLTTIAKEFSVSIPHAKREFSKRYGCGIINCFLDLKIKKAKELMTATPLNLTQIADYLAFESENHFSKTFKKRVGIIPKEWRNQHEQ